MVAMTESGYAEAPRRGRPRSSAVDEAVLAATLDLAGRVGVNGMSMDDVAELAKVSKASIYRRWPSKEALVLDALRSALTPFEVVDTGSLAGDLRTYLVELARRFNKGRMSDVLPHLIGVACHEPSLRSSLDEYIHCRRQPLREILDRGVRRGEVSPAVDGDVLIDVILGPFAYRRLLSHQVIDEVFIDRLLGLVLPAVASDA